MDKFNDMTEQNYETQTTRDSSTIESDQKESPQNLPKDYIRFDVELIICALDFSVENEYSQKIIELSLTNFIASHQQSYNISRSIISLEDFKV